MNLIFGILSILCFLLVVFSAPIKIALIPLGLVFLVCMLLFGGSGPIVWPWIRKV